MPQASPSSDLQRWTKRYVRLNRGIFQGSKPTLLQIAIAAQSIRSSRTKLDFLNAFAADPRAFVQTWLDSQSRDLDVVLGNEQGVREEDLKNSQFFAMPWVGRLTVLL